MSVSDGKCPYLSVSHPALPRAMLPTQAGYPHCYIGSDCCGMTSYIHPIPESAQAPPGAGVQWTPSEAGRRRVDEADFAAVRPDACQALAANAFAGHLAGLSPSASPPARVPHGQLPHLPTKVERNSKPKTKTRPFWPPPVATTTTRRLPSPSVNLRFLRFLRFLRVSTSFSVLARFPCPAGSPGARLESYHERA